MGACCSASGADIRKKIDKNFRDFEKFGDRYRPNPPVVSQKFGMVG